MPGFFIVVTFFRAQRQALELSFRTNIFMPMSQSLSHVLANVADTYTPILLITAVIDVVLRWRAGSHFHGFRLLGVAVVVYGWMFADKYFQLWAQVGLDYSTHTAAAFALVVSISINKSIFTKILLGLSLLIYGCLMFVLSYHSWSDMFITAVIVGGCLAPIFLWKNKRRK